MKSLQSPVAVLPALIALAFCACPVNEGTSSEPATYTVSTAEELLEWASAVKSGEYYANCILACDIDMAGMEWTPLSFYGTFDGQGNAISNLAVSSDTEHTGFIGYLARSAAVKGLKLVNATVAGTNESSGSRTGGIAGIAYGAVSGCSFSGTVTGKGYAGGIAGELAASGSITGCSSSGAVESSGGRGLGYAGGIAGYANVKWARGNGGITACYSDADVTATEYAGGIAGGAYSYSDASSHIAACYSSGAAKSEGHAGGILGKSDGYTLIGCYSTAEVSCGAGYSAGGIVGYMYRGDTTACYWSGNAESGVGNVDSGASYADSTVKVTDSGWSGAMSAMNTALKGGGYSYSYRINSGDDSEGFPLALE